MKAFSSILVVIPFHSSHVTLRSLVLSSMGLGKWLGCEVHFLAELSSSQRVQTAIAEFQRSDKHAPSTLIINPTAENAADRVLETIRKYACGLVILQDSVLLHPTKGTDERKLLELSPSPVLLLPKDFDFRKYPHRGFLVPLSGESRLSPALAVTLRLADQTSSTVDFLHVMEAGKPCTCGQAMEVLGDQLHHEYRHIVDKIAAEASPFSTARERSHIHRFIHCSGFTAAEIAKHLEASPGEILVLEWRGTFASGHAEVVKGVLQRTRSPILFVRAVHEKKSTLRVGRNLHAA